MQVANMILEQEIYPQTLVKEIFEITIIHSWY